MQSKRTLWLFACDPLSVVVVTSEVVTDSWVDGAVVVQSTVQNVRIITALRRNGCGVVLFKKSKKNKKLQTIYLMLYKNCKKSKV